MLPLRARHCTAAARRIVIQFSSSQSICCCCRRRRRRRCCRHQFKLPMIVLRSIGAALRRTELRRMCLVKNAAMFAQLVVKERLCVYLSVCLFTDAASNYEDSARVVCLSSCAPSCLYSGWLLNRLPSLDRFPAPLARPHPLSLALISVWPLAAADELENRQRKWRTTHTCCFVRSGSRYHRKEPLISNAVSYLRSSRRF